MEEDKYYAIAYIRNLKNKLVKNNKTDTPKLVVTSGEREVGRGRIGVGN